jgi:hypothetical protein
MREEFCCYGFCPTIIQIELTIIPYFTRIKEMDRVGVEATTCGSRPAAHLVQDLPLIVNSRTAVKKH